MLWLHAAFLLLCSTAAARLVRRQDARPSAVRQLAPRSLERDTTYRFRNGETEQYLVSSLPEVTFDFGEMYSGLIPIDLGDTSRALFFIFLPKPGAPVDEITVWLNGGPGCSSMEGFLQENGPISWQTGTLAPVANPYAWSNETNMLWIDQPVGTGYSIGTPRARNEVDSAAEFVSFFKNWQDVFGIQNYKVFLTGESYAGRYIPYIASAMLDQKNTAYFDVKGALMYDPTIGEFEQQGFQTPAYPHIAANNNLWGFNASFLAELKDMHTKCGYADYMDKYLAFPPPGQQPSSVYNYSQTKCNVADLALDVVSNINPCFNPYMISDHCPLLWSVIGVPSSLEYVPPGGRVYFDRADVKTALHAPDVAWHMCAPYDSPVFVGASGPEDRNDESPDPIQGVLPKVIEATNRVLISNGDLDFIVLNDGTMLAIQNMTWNGQLGFQARPSEAFIVDEPDTQWAQVYKDNGYDSGPQGQGQMGVQHFERGLMWVQTWGAGHMQPQYQPRAAYKHLRWVLGRIDDLGK